ncbi:hypothetical protein CN916_30045 [Bacillus thuringiensis]|nr:hypothetical protein CN916_30045 [Bacillus thuringiensis]
MNIIKNNKHNIALFIALYSIFLSIYFGIPVFKSIFHISHENLNLANVTLSLYFFIMVFVFLKIYKKHKIK